MDSRLIAITAFALLFFDRTANAEASGFKPSATASPPALLPAGFMSVRGAQLVGSDGLAVRIASVGLTGMNVIGGLLELVGPFSGVHAHVAAMKRMGFNCVRADWINKTLEDEGGMAQLDEFVAECKNA